MLPLALMLAGCTDQPPPSTASGTVATPRASVALKVLVVNDPELARAINRLRGEWTEREGGTLTAESKSWADLASAEAIDADVIVFPARHLGALVERNQLRLVRESAVHGKLYAADDVFPLARQKLANYGGRPMALPLNVLVPLIGYRRDWLSESGGAPPSSWSAYRNLVAATGEQPLTWPARDAVESWLAIELLARAAAYASHPHQEGILFDPQTMSARIAEMPFVRALEEWQKEAKAASQRLAADEQAKQSGASQGEAIVWAEWPGAEHVFNRSSREWEPTGGGLRRVSLIADGQVVGVSAKSRNAASAFGLAAWLTSPEIGGQLGAVGKVGLPVRRSQLSAAGKWIDSPSVQADSSQVARVLQAALDRDDALVVPRIPGVDEYMAALAAAVEKALAGEEASADALDRAAKQWDKITDRLGREAQRQSYLKHLGITGP